MNSFFKIINFKIINFKLIFFFFLQQLYLATGDPLSADESSTATQSLSLAEPVACSNSNEPLLCSDTVLRDGQQQAEQLCVVCHYFPLSRALLPCRHTCICAVCFCEYKMNVIEVEGLKKLCKSKHEPEYKFSDF
jgi:hypothetical protein